LARKCFFSSCAASYTRPGLEIRDYSFQFFPHDVSSLLLPIHVYDGYGKNQVEGTLTQVGSTHPRMWFQEKRKEAYILNPRQVWKETHVFLWKEDHLSWKEKPMHSLNSRPGLDFTKWSSPFHLFCFFFSFYLSFFFPLVFYKITIHYINTNLSSTLIIKQYSSIKYKMQEL
jgi:hypothetical protein